MKVLQIINSAYRGTIEEQDDTVVWITHALKGAGGDLAVLLQGNAVNYAVKAQNADGLSFGDWQQTQPPQLPRDISGLIGKDVPVYVITEDCEDRGLTGEELIEGIGSLTRSDLAGFFDDYDQVWQW